MSKFGEYFVAQKKSPIKAGDGKPSGRYKFFNSSNVQTKFYDDYLFDKPALIFGTGGNASVHYCTDPFATSTDCIVFYAKNDSINMEMVYQYLSGNIELLEAGFKGASIKHISRAYIEEIDIPIIPKEKQRSIVTSLNQATQTIDLCNAILEKLDLLVKARFVEMFGDPVENTHCLPLQTLPELGEFGRGVSKHRPRNAPELLGGKYPLIQTGDVANSSLYIYHYNSTYSEIGFKQSKMWKKGTLCITIAANIAKTAILTFDSCFPDSVVGFNANESTNNIYIHYWFSFFQAILEEQAPESAQKNINLKILSELKVIVPPIELQNQFAAFVEKTDRTKATVKQVLAKAETLKKALMQEYFG